MQAYYETAHNVASRLMGGETGEKLVDEIAAMQECQRKAVALIKKATGFDQDELSQGFAAVRNANRRADEFRLAIGLVGVVLVVALSLWVSQRMLRGLGHLSSGFSRFATGDFAREIPVTSSDELGNAAREANQMAASLKRLAEQRDRNLWLRGGEAGLSDELRGEFAPRDVAARALQFLARRISAVAGAWYLNDGSDGLELVSHYGQVSSQARTQEDAEREHSTKGSGTSAWARGSSAEQPSTARFRSSPFPGGVPARAVGSGRGRPALSRAVAPRARGAHRSRGRVRAIFALF